jgi:hypothetical protein
MGMEQFTMGQLKWELDWDAHDNIHRSGTQIEVEQHKWKWDDLRMHNAPG